MMMIIPQFIQYMLHSVHWLYVSWLAYIFVPRECLLIRSNLKIHSFYNRTHSTIRIIISSTYHTIGFHCLLLCYFLALFIYFFYFDIPCDFVRRVDYFLIGDSDDVLNVLKDSGETLLNDSNSKIFISCIQNIHS